MFLYMGEVYQQISEIKTAIRKKTDCVPDVALILGSGLGSLTKMVKDAVDIPYGDLPYFPDTGVVGHEGRLWFGELAGRQAAILSGRFHAYEGHHPSVITLPIRVLHQLGAQWLIVTNASGGISESLHPGQLMVITDHINNMGRNPLVGPHDPALGERFLDMSAAYDIELRAIAHRVARDRGIDLGEGVYMGCLGPVFETPAEIRVFQKMGVDAVGMSTIPEVIVARHVGMRVLGISCICNMAAGTSPQPLNHLEVLEMAERSRDSFISLITGVLEHVGSHEVTMV